MKKTKEKKGTNTTKIWTKTKQRNTTKIWKPWQWHTTRVQFCFYFFVPVNFTFPMLPSLCIHLHIFYPFSQTSKNSHPQVEKNKPQG